MPAPARYLPLGPRPFRFDIGLSRLDRDFGNGSADARVFQLDTAWPVYRQAKHETRAESLGKYFGELAGEEPVIAAAAREMARRLGEEYPRLFHFEACASGWQLHNRWFGERLRCEGARALLTPAPRPDGGRVLDALALQVPDDIAVVHAAHGAPRVVALHICYPNHWAPADKLGRDFQGVHAPVPGISRLARDERRLHEVLVDQGPWVRFAWGLATDRRLNHHPLPPPGASPSDWAGRAFNPEKPRLWLRVERQVMLPVAGFSAYVFLIRTYFEPVSGLDRDERRQLAHALATMDASVLAYKGLADSRDAILDWLCSQN